MNPEAQRIAIAEACGWGIVSDYGKGRIYGYHNRQPSYDVAECPPCSIPDYLADLNAMAEAEKVLTDEQWNFYETWIWRITLSDAQNRKERIEVVQAPSCRIIIIVTAAQRAEAFLRTIGKWDATEREASPAPESAPVSTQTLPPTTDA